MYDLPLFFQQSKNRPACQPSGRCSFLIGFKPTIYPFAMLSVPSLVSTHPPCTLQAAHVVIEVIWLTSPMSDFAVMTVSFHAVDGLFAGRRSEQKDSRLVLTSVLAIAGGAAIWGLLVLSVHLFSAPSAGLRFSAVNGSSSHVQKPPPTRLQEVSCFHLCNNGNCHAQAVWLET